MNKNTSYNVQIAGAIFVVAYRVETSRGTFWVLAKSSGGHEKLKHQRLIKYRSEKAIVVAAISHHAWVVS